MGTIELKRPDKFNLLTPRTLRFEAAMLLSRKTGKDVSGLFDSVAMLSRWNIDGTQDLGCSWQNASDGCSYLIISNVTIDDLRKSLDWFSSKFIEPMTDKLIDKWNANGRI